MAATDQTYRNQKALDIVFAVSSIAMLVSMIGMFIQDYNREWKTEQREFRDVEAAMFTRQAIMELPDAKRYEEVKKAVEKAREARKTGEERIKQLERDIAKLAPTKERQEQKVGDLKADLASKASFFDMAADRYGASSPQAKGYKEEVEKLETKVAAAQDELDKTLADLKKNQQEKDGIEKPLVVAQTELKRLNDDLIRKARAAIKSQWGFGDWFRNLPVIDAFAAPTKIHQFTLNELTIDYNFKGVTRFDRCMTCHQGIDRPAYTKDRLRALVEEPSAELVANLESAKERLKELPSELAGTSDEANLPRPGDLRLTPLSKNKLTPSRINEFCAHPRLELFVGSNSKHPAEKFGCTSCHAGQGSGTEFKWASHTPNDSKQLKEWKKNLGWESIHFWDFPMLPKRFVEASCLKCHHQVTDLITSGNRQEAPKLFRGYNLIRENGCFGCHEIPGKKNGVPIGPDMRLEPYPPLEMVTAAERARMLADTDNPPGTLRKVGPSLFRLSEKTNKEWMAKWIKSPRSFRPDTKMPHFYGLSNNNEEALKGTGQEKFPDAEAASIAHFLFAESNSYLTLLGDMYKNKDKRDIAYYETIVRETSAEVANKAKFSALPLFEQDALLKKLDDAKTSMIALKQEAPAPIHAEKAPKKSEASLVNGRKLFSERGCLACHNHAGTTTPMSVGKDEKVPAIHSEAHFGPTLSQITEKLGTQTHDKDSARTWLIHWVQNPKLHSPRTRMPVTHLDDQEAADVAEWLLSQKATELGSDWNTLTVAKPNYDTLKTLANVYLVRILSRSEMETFFGKDGLPESRIKELPQDEKALATKLARFKADEAKREQETMWYVGRKAVGRLGCFGCHDIPGFENTKPIGTPLSDWGKKDPERLAFENIANYMKDKHTPVEDWHDLSKIAEVQKAGDKTPYEGFFWDALDHRTREGYLHQKIKEPRSYDYGRLRAWDDRSRMPQFKLAHPRRLAEESKEDFETRTEWVEDLNAGLPKDQRKPTPRRRPAESTEQFSARAVQEEADAREAVMTFVLGLVGEAIPAQYLNNPSPDRLAEVKGRQVLDRFNCAGCHTIRPGTFDFEPSDKQRLQLNRQWQVSQRILEGDFFFPESNLWQGQPSAIASFLRAHGTRPELSVIEDPTDKTRRKKVLSLQVTLSQALAWREPSGAVKNIAGGNTILQLLADDLTSPPPEALQTPESLRGFVREYGPYGGAFADLLSRYLVERSPDIYKPDTTGGKESQYARSASPPLLINQGEKTQPDWLFRFLRDPPRVRVATVLRMPRFNMSDDEARALVDYFSAVERLNNPGIGLTHPYVNLPQRDELTTQFWRDRTKEYVARLKARPDPNQPDRKLYDTLLKEYEPVWETITRQAKAKFEAAEANRKAADKKFDEAKAAAEKKKDDKQLAAALKAAEEDAKLWTEESKRLKEEADKVTVPKLRDEWLATEAAATGGYRMLTKGLCYTCHELGPFKLTGQPIQAGPSLNLANERLRPDWVERWLANPKRYLPYTPMPPPFAAHEEKFQEFVAGTSRQQILTVRDTLMNLPRINALPVNQHWLFPEGTSKKEGEKK